MSLDSRVDSLIVSSSSTDSLPVETSFRQDLDAAFHGLRGALTEALAAVGGDPSKARELGRLLGVNKNLAWRAGKIVTARTAVDAVPHVPGPQALRGLVGALAEAGLTKVARVSLEKAFADYVRMRHEHSGDRASFEQLVAGLADDKGARERFEYARRQAHAGLGSTWGVQARTQFLTIVLGPARDDGDEVDVVGMSGLIGLRRMRPDARWTLHKRRRLLDDGSVAPPADSELLDPDGDPDGPPLMRAFSSADVRDLEVVHAGAQVRWLLPPGPVGNKAACDAVFGAINRRAASTAHSDVNEALRFWVAQTTPVELTQVDLLVHVGHAWAGTPKAILRSQLEGVHGPVNDDRCHPRLPLHESVHALGRGMASMASIDVPRYSELLGVVVERTGWDPTAFVGHRLTMRYPPIPTIMALSLTLPDRNAD